MESSAFSCKNGPQRFVSWWIDWHDLDWPDPDNLDRIRRRADSIAESGADAAMVFGAHFRWDFMPYWTILHDYLATVAEELHQRNLRLFDHHSASLIHRYDTREEARQVKLHSGPHLPFAPSREAAASWSFQGKLLNDWRMRDLRDGGILQLPQYAAEQFCHSNPDFRDAYLEYVRRLLAETGIDGLMCDDLIHFMGYISCGCRWCRAKFRESCDSELPPWGDTGFWGNWENPAWRTWLELRFRANGDFLAKVRSVLPEDFPMLSCCSGSSSPYALQIGQDIREFNRGCSMILLEMGGNTPPYPGDPVTWNPPLYERVAQSAHHLATARHTGQCIGLGYGFHEISGNVIWALNKSLGCGTWFSTLKARLGLPLSLLRTLPDDAAPVAVAYRFEQKHPELFDSEARPEIGVFFSYETRNNTAFGAMNTGYIRDFNAALNLCAAHGLPFAVALEIPEEPDRFKVLLLPSAARMSGLEKQRLSRYAARGGVVLATGPSALPEEDGFALPDRLVPGNDEEPEIAPSSRPARWQMLTENIVLHPVRTGEGAEAAALLKNALLKHLPRGRFLVEGGDGYLKFPRYTGRCCLLHLLAAEYDTEVDRKLEAMRRHRSRVNVIRTARPRGVNPRLFLRGVPQVTVILPFQPDRKAKLSPTPDGIHVELPEECIYAILQFPLEMTSEER